MTARKFIKISSRALLITLVVFAILLGSAYALLRLPKVQTYLTAQLTTQLTEDLGTTVRVGGVDVGFFNRVILENLYVEDQHNDTLAYFDALHLGFNGSDRKTKIISIGEVTLDGAKFFVHKHKGEDRLNVMFLVDHFKVEKDTSVKRWDFTFEDLAIHRSAFEYVNHNKDHTSVGIDYFDLDVRNIDLNIDDIRIEGDTVFGNVLSLSCLESRGFRLDQIKGVVKVAPDVLVIDDAEVQTENSLVQCDIVFTYETWSDYLHFIDNVDMDIEIRPGSILDLADLSFFAPALVGLGNDLIVSGHVSGTVRSLKGRNMDIRFGNATRLRGNIAFDGLPKIDETFMFLDLKELTTNYQDLKTIPIPPFKEDRSLTVPSNISRLGRMRFSGNFTGFVNDFVAYGKLRTRLGTISSDVLLKQDQALGMLTYKGRMSTDRLDIGEYLGIDSIGRISLDASVDGKGLTAETMDAFFEGRIIQAEVLSYDYKNIDLNGHLWNKRFEGDYSINDENLDMGFAGVVDFGGEKPYFNFRSTVQKANLNKLNLIKNRTDATVKGDVVFNFTGDNIDDLVGNIDLYNFNYTEPGDSFRVGNVHLEVAEDDGSRHLLIDSEVLDARFDGRFKFSALGVAANHLIEKHLPRYATDTTHLHDDIDLDFGFFLELHRSDLLMHILYPNMTLASGTRLAGRYSSSENLLSIDGHIPSMTIGEVQFTDITAQADNPTEIFQLNLNCAAVNLSDSAYIRNITATTGSFDSRIDFGLDWNNLSQRETLGRVTGRFDFEEGDRSVLKFNRSLVSVRGLQWIIDPLAEVMFDSTGISISALSIENEWQKLAVAGRIGKLETDILNVSLEAFDVGNTNLLLERTGLTFNGSVTGNAQLKALLGEFNFTSDLQVDSLSVNDRLIGSGKINNHWVAATSGISIDALLEHDGIKGLAVSGVYFPQKKSNNYNLRASFEGMPVNAFEHYVEKIISDIDGTASADITITGPTKAPILKGYVHLDSTSVMVNYLNTRYVINDFIKVDPTGFTMADVDVRDIYGKQGSINGYLHHTNFKDWNFDATLDANNFFALNTNSAMNSLFHGKGFVSGLVNFSGKPGDIFMDLSLKTEKGSTLFIPLDGAKSVTESDFITFKKYGNETEDDGIDDAYKVDLSSLTMNLDMELTPDAQVQLIFDQKTGDIMKGRGTGDIKMKMDRLSGFKMFGDFVIREGDYLFTLQNIINKRFKVNQGGTISWSGDPYDATIDITALYSVRTSLYDLMYPDTTEDAYRKRVLVDCTLKMKDKLMNPSIEFGIDLPNVSDQINTEVKNKIGIGNVQEMNRQVFGLMVLNKFFPVAGNSLGQETGGFLTASSAEMLSNQLSNWLSKISNDFDVGVNYRPGNEITSDEVELALSTQILNNRVIIDGNVGVANNNNSDANSNNASNIVGDVTVEYKITEDGRFRIKAFNKSNDINSLTDNNAPFTQGVGISYRKEFESFIDLFSFLKRKKKKEDEEGVKPEDVEVPE